MCGFVGWVDFTKSLMNNDEAKKYIHKMNNTQKHRGPDDENIFYHKHLFLGHRRLSIIDLEYGKQPFSCRWQGHNYTITYNGEIYNTNTLSTELKKKGYPIKSSSDTETLLWSYIDDKDNFLEKLNGMFAFMIWDESLQQVLIVRDPLGIKPLFFARLGSGWFFSSEIKALLKHPHIKPYINRESLCEILAMYPGRVPGNTPFYNIKELKPGYKLSINKSKNHFTKYFSLNNKHQTEDLETVTAYLKQKIKHTVIEQLNSDVPLGAMLSGGIDSSLICAISNSWYKEQGFPNLQTYAVNYADDIEDFHATKTQPDLDIKFISIMVNHLNTKHQNIIIDPKEIINEINNAAYMRDLPGMADVDASLLIFARRMKKDIKVVLSGEGADEIFGGYPWFHKEITSQDTLDTFPWINNIEARISFLRTEWIKKLSPKEYVNSCYENACKEIPVLDPTNKTDTYMRKITYLTLNYWLPVLLERKDRMTMATGLETRVPFCDANLVKFLWNVPWEMKKYNNTTKGLLKHICQGILPEEIINRPKNPYPRTHNPLYYNSMKEIIIQKLKDPKSPLSEFLDPKQIKRFLEPNAKTSFAWFGQIMQAPSLLGHWVQLDAWWQKYNIDIKI